MTNTVDMLCLPAPDCETGATSACEGEGAGLIGGECSMHASGEPGKVEKHVDVEQALWDVAESRNPDRVEDVQAAIEGVRCSLAAWDNRLLAAEANSDEIERIIRDSYPCIEWLVKHPAEAEAMGCNNVKIAPQARSAFGDKAFAFVWCDVRSQVGRSQTSKARTVILAEIGRGTTTERFLSIFSKLAPAYDRAAPIFKALVTARNTADESLEPSLETQVGGLSKKQRDLVDAALDAEPLCAVPDNVPTEGEVELLIRRGKNIQGPLAAPIKEVVRLIGKFGIDRRNV